MLAESQNSSNGGDVPKLRAACENCRQSKVKCNLGGKNACIRCLRHGLPCRYRVANRSGKPKGSKNRATLRKLGQLQDDKPSPQTAANSPRPPKNKAVEQVCLEEVDRSIDYEYPVSTRETSHPSLSESPNTHDSGMAVNTCMLLSEPAAMDYASTYGAPFSPSMPMCASASMSPTSPTFLQKAFITKGLTSFPLAVHIPDTLQPTCECDSALAFHLNRLRHAAIDPVRPRFDQSLQSTKTALSACQGFLQCAHCHKENTNLILSVSTLDLILQQFDFWVNYEFATPGIPPPAVALDPEPVTYGEYTTGPEETRQIRRIVLRGRLQQCKEVLGLLHETVEMAEGSGGPDGNGNGSVPGQGQSHEGSWLQQIIRGYATTTDAFLQPLLGCVCTT